MPWPSVKDGYSQPGCLLWAWGQKYPPFLPVPLPSLVQTTLLELGVLSPSHPGASCPQWAMEIPNRPVSNFESGWRGGDVGGAGLAGWKPSAFQAELFLTQPGKTCVVLLATIIFSCGSSQSSSPG